MFFQIWIVVMFFSVDRPRTDQLNDFDADPSSWGTVETKIKIKQETPNERTEQCAMPSQKPNNLFGDSSQIGILSLYYWTTTITHTNYIIQWRYSGNNPVGDGGNTMYSCSCTPLESKETKWQTWPITNVRRTNHGAAYHPKREKCWKVGKGIKWCKPQQN